MNGDVRLKLAISALTSVEERTGTEEVTVSRTHATDCLLVARVLH